MEKNYKEKEFLELQFGISQEGLPEPTAWFREYMDHVSETYDNSVPKTTENSTSDTESKVSSRLEKGLKDSHSQEDKGPDTKSYSPIGEALGVNKLGENSNQAGSEIKREAFKLGLQKLRRRIENE